MSELFDKVNAQKENLPGFMQAPASPQKVCNENERSTKKKRWAPKIFLMGGRSL